MPILTERYQILKKLLLSSFILYASLAVFAADKKSYISSTSTVDWSKSRFISNVNLDTEKAGISMPSQKKAASNMIDTQLPILVKDSLLSLNVNSTQQLIDLVLDQTITLEQLTQIIDDGKKTPGYFKNGTLTLSIQHFINISEISSLMIKHHFPYKNPKPIETIPSRAYTGIIIDARGKLNVHGEFVKDEVEPCFFPQIWDENMNLIYERNMGNPESESKNGVIRYEWSDDESLYQDRIGLDPMRIRAREVYGEIRTDPVITREDALKILTVPENLELLQQGKVVILLDKENLIYTTKPTEKTDGYYATYREIKQYFLKNEEPPIIQPTKEGVQLLYDLKFVADQAQLLDSELPKIKTLSEILKKLNEDNAFTILVEGHTADVNKPEGQMNLSIQRTQTIINELVKNGLPRSIFSYKGYGGTHPIASNDTAEGRALNRRVIITARPKATYIQRR